MGKMGGVITIAYELWGLKLQKLFLNICFSSWGIHYTYLYQFLTTLSFPKVANIGKL